MKNKKTILVVSLGLVLLIGGAYLLYERLGGQVQRDNLTVQQAETSETKVQTESADVEGETQEKTEAPDFTVYHRDGEEVQLSDFRGKPVILNFWASWCGPCKSEMPDFDEAYKKYGEEIHFLMVNLTDGYQETMKKATTFVEESGYSFPVYYDKDSEAGQTYQVFSIPTTYFIDAEGFFVAQGNGALDKGTLQRGIDILLDSL
nr:TlpA family protein disulfide reductase [Eubacterium sp.]